MNFGVAINGVTSVSFRTAMTPDGIPTGPEVTVPVTGNFWSYPSNSNDPPSTSNLSRPTSPTARPSPNPPPEQTAPPANREQHTRLGQCSGMTSERV
jgi:hypothetical protein